MKMGHFNILSILSLILALATHSLAGAVFERANTQACNRDNCFRAVIASNAKPGPSVGSRDCSSFQAGNTATASVGTVTTTSTTTTTVTTSTVTVTEASLATAAPTVTNILTIPTTVASNLLTLTVTQSSIVSITKTALTVITPAAALKRAATASVPSYASACSGSSRYASACSCNGIRAAQTTTVGGTTRTVTSTATAFAVATTTASQFSTLTLPTTITNTDFVPTTIDITAATLTVPDVSTEVVTVVVTSTAIPEPAAPLCEPPYFAIQVVGQPGTYLSYQQGFVVVGTESSCYTFVDGHMVKSKVSPESQRWNFVRIDTKAIIFEDQYFDNSGNVLTLTCNTTISNDATGVYAGPFTCPMDGAGASQTDRRFYTCPGELPDNLRFLIPPMNDCTMLDLVAVP